MTLNAASNLVKQSSALRLGCAVQVSSAAPVAAALASGTASDATLSRMYGGSAAEGVSELSMAIPVYEAIGKVNMTACNVAQVLQSCAFLYYIQTLQAYIRQQSVSSMEDASSDSCHLSRLPKHKSWFGAMVLHKVPVSRP